jgi:hypothetical protein
MVSLCGKGQGRASGVRRLRSGHADIAVQHKIAALQQPYGFESVRFFTESRMAPQRMEIWPG